MMESFGDCDQLIADVSKGDTVDDVLGNVFIKKTCCITNLDSCLDLITCENPDFDTSIL